MSNDDFSDDQRELEKRLRAKWGMNSPSKSLDEPTGVSPLVEFHMYTRQILNDRGGADTYWRFDRIQGSTSSIHREVNTRMMAMMELDKLRSAGYVVHEIKTPESMSLSAQKARKKELEKHFESSKNIMDVIDLMMTVREPSGEHN